MPGLASSTLISAYYTGSRARVEIVSNRDMI